MAFVIKDKKLDEDIEKIMHILRNDFGIRNASKADAVRYVMGQKKQGRKTHPLWGKLI